MRLASRIVSVFLGIFRVRRDAEYNWAQARADFATAVTLCDAGIYYASVFFAQQAAEKALRAANLESLHKSSRGHNLVAMADALQAPIEVMNAAAEFNDDFLNTRTPESAEGLPFLLYDHQLAEIHLQAAKIILDWIRDHFIALS